MADVKVLIAGCSATVRRIARKRADEAGLIVIDQWTKEDGNRKLGGGHGADVVLVDRDFMELSGWSRPPKGRQGVPVIVLGGGHTDWFVEAVRRGVSDYLAPPFSADDLKARVELVLAARSRRMAKIYGIANLHELYEAAQPSRDVLGQDEIDALLSSTEPEVEQAPEEEDALSSAMREEMARDAQGEATDSTEGEDLLARAMHETLSGEKLYEEAGPPVPAATSDSRITSYDFKHPARVNKDQLRVLENLHDQFARLLSRSLSGHMRQVVDVDTAFVDQTTYREFIMSLSNPCLSYQFKLGEAGQAIFDIAMPVVCGIVDRAMGGRGSSQGVSPRQVTQIEIQQINLVAKKVIDDLEATWRPIKSLLISDVELETNPEFMQITAASEIVILLAFEINTSQASGLLSVCYPFFTLEPLLHLLGRRSPEPSPRLGREERRLANRLRLGDVDLGLTAELGRTHITTGEAAGLAAGDVICLQSRCTDPSRVYIGGQPQFLAWPLAEEGDVKLKIAGRIPPHLVPKYGTAARD